jgi:hypothetical protein
MTDKCKHSFSFSMDERKSRCCYCKLDRDIFMYEQGKKDEIDLTIKEYNKWDNSKSKTWFQDYLNKRKKELAEK